MVLSQRHLVNRRLRLADGEVVTKYVFPFWDRDWRVVFYLLDRLGRPPAILRGAIHPDVDIRLASPAKMADLGTLESVDPKAFRDLFHYDPWWVFRGIGGVPEAWKNAILPTNIAKPFRLHGHHWKIHDVEIDPGGDRIGSIVAKDEMFRRREFTTKDLDLNAIWPRGAISKR